MRNVLVVDVPKTRNHKVVLCYGSFDAIRDKDGNVRLQHYVPLSELPFCLRETQFDRVRVGFVWRRVQNVGPVPSESQVLVYAGVVGDDDVCLVEIEVIDEFFERTFCRQRL